MAAVTAAVVGAGAAIYGTVKSAQAGSAAAKAQGSIAQQQYAMAEKSASFAAPTADELKTLGNQVKLYDSAYANSQAQLQTLQKQVTDTYGANIVEQGQQLHQALIGQATVATQQAQDDFGRKRQAYQQQLTDRLGPGALTSSAGIQAMNNFDRNASQALASIQDNSINQEIQRLGGLQSGQNASLQGIMGINSSLSGMLGNIQQTQNVFQTRQSNAWSGLAQYAGADQVQGLQEAKNSAQTAANIAGIGSQLVGAGIGAYSYGQKAPVNPQAKPDVNGIGGAAQLNTSGFKANGQGQLTGNSLAFTPVDGVNSNGWGE